MIYPLMQPRQLLLIPALLCILLMLPVGLPKIYAADIPFVPLTPVVNEDPISTSPTLRNLTPNFILQQSAPTFPKNSTYGSAVLTLHNANPTTSIYQLQLYSRGGMPVFDQLGTISSNGSVLIAADDLVDVPDGDYQVRINSDRPLNTLVAIKENVSQSLGLYGGIAPIASEPIFGPLFVGEARSTLVLANTFAATVTTRIDLNDLSGATVATHTEMLPAYGGTEVDLTTIEGVPSDFVGTATVISQDGNFTGVVQQVDAQGKISYQNPLPQRVEEFSATGVTASNNTYFPQVYLQALEDGNLPIRTSSLLIKAIVIDQTNVTAFSYDYINQSQTDLFGVMTLSNRAGFLGKLSEIPELNAGKYSVVIRSDHPILASEITTFDEPSSYGADSYYPATDPSLDSTSVKSAHAEKIAYLPRIVKKVDSHSVIAVQNIGVAASTFNIGFHDGNGTLLHSYVGPALQPNQATSIDLRTIAQLPFTFMGSAQIASDQSFASHVDEFHNFATSLNPNPFTLSISGPDRALIHQSIQAVASVTPNTATLGSALYPVNYTWMPNPNNAASWQAVSNGITSTATITWGEAGFHVASITAKTGVGQVTETYTVAVSARSLSISSLQTTTFRYNDFDGSSLHVLVPAQTIVGSIQLDYMPTPGVHGPVAQGFEGQAFALHVIQNQRPISDYTFEQAVVMTIVYDTDGLNGGDETVLTLRRWNGIAWIEVSADCGLPPMYIREPDSNQFSFQLCQSGEFALFGSPVSIFLPVMQQ